MKNKIFLNIVFSCVYQIISIMVGILLPRALLVAYGATTHGMISTINNIMSYIMLLNAGLSTAAMQSLYRPLGEKNYYEVNAIFNAIKRYYYHTAILFFIAVMAVAYAFPFIIKENLPNYKITILICIMGLQYVLENIFLNAEKTLLQADNRLYYINIINSISYLLRGILQLSFIWFGFSILIVMLVPIILVLLRAFLVHYYTKKTQIYLDKTVQLNKMALNKRKYAFIHQISGLVLNNTDTIVLSVFWTQKIVSKYCIYALIFNYIYIFMSQIFSASIVSTIGKNVLLKERKEIHKFFSVYELLNCIALTCIYSTANIMVLSFVELYTSGVDGVIYEDAIVSILFIIYGVANSMRIPSLTFVDAAGMYKETQHQAIIEMFINLLVSILLCSRYGIAGVLLGTIASFVYRTLALILFVNKRIIIQNNIKSILRLLTAYIVVISSNIVYSHYFLIEISCWTQWFINVIIVFFVCLFFTIAIFAFFNFKDYRLIYKKIKKRIV